MNSSSPFAHPITVYTVNKDFPSNNNTSPYHPAKDETTGSKLQGKHHTKPREAEHESRKQTPAVHSVQYTYDCRPFPVLTNEQLPDAPYRIGTH